MRKHPVSKFIGLTVLYAAVIIGIFVFQFKAESIISKSLGALHVSLYQTENEEGLMLFKNQFQVSFKGLSFNGDPNSEVTLKTSNNEYIGVQLESYTERTDLSIELLFSNNTSIIFTVTDPTPNAELYIQAKFPSEYECLILPYKLDKTIAVSAEHQTANRIVTINKNVTQALVAHEATENSLIFSRYDSIATYSAFDPTKRFTFEELEGLAGTEESLYNDNVQMLRSKVITLTNQLLNSASADSITEPQVSAYVAEMAANGRWQEALDNVPEAFKKGNRRTYFTAPYFDNLVNMNRSLVVETDKFASITQSAVEARNLDIFCVQGITDYILREKYTQPIQSLLSFPGRMDSFEPTPSQCAGLLYTYTYLYSRDKKLASQLNNVIEPCVAAIMDLCKLDDEIFSLNAEDNFGAAQRIMLGNSLIALGKIQTRTDIENAGRIIFNQAAENPQTLELRTLADIYPYIAESNTYYPHTVILGYYNSTPVWAWTCAKEITYEIVEEGVVNLNIDFPLGFTHYIFFNGVPTFHSNIEIQRQMFRSDPRFESYNSSGYVYQTDTQTLFIKSRHKSQIELIRLFCDPTNSFRSPGSN